MDNFIWIFQFIATCVIGLIGYFVKQMSNDFKKSIEGNKSNVNRLEKELSDYKLQMEKDLNEYKLEQEKEITKRFDNYISRKEFITVISNLDKKLEDIYTAIIQKGVNADVGK